MAGPKWKCRRTNFPLLRHPPRRASGGQLDSSQRLTSKRQRSKKSVCVPRPFAVGYASHPDDPSSPEAAEKDALRPWHSCPWAVGHKHQNPICEGPGFPARLTMLHVAVARDEKAYTPGGACGLRMHTPCRDPAHRFRREEKSGMPAGLPGSHRGGAEPSIEMAIAAKDGP